MFNILSDRLYSGRSDLGEVVSDPVSNVLLTQDHHKSLWGFIQTLHALNTLSMDESIH